MITTAEQLVEDFCKNGWESNPFDRLIPLLEDEREQALPLALLILDQIPEGGTFFDYLLSHLTAVEFEALVATAVARLRDGQSDVLDSVVAYASIQLPHLLTPFLRELFDLKPNARSYYAQWPWRAADTTEIAALKEIILSTSEADLRRQAWKCLVETRCAKSIEFAATHFPVALGQGGGFAAYSQLAGYDSSSHPPRRLHTEQSYHVIFPDSYLDDARSPPWKKRSGHPTWSLDTTEAFVGQFGGTMTGKCGSCGELLHLLLRVENAGLLFGASCASIDLCTCLSCLGCESDTLFFAHDSSGKPLPLYEDKAPVIPKFPSEPLKATPVHYVRSPARWTFQDWGLSNGRENLNRIGGAPSWIQSSCYPSCPKCKELMTFAAQLDSGLPTADSGEWLWGSGGICYVFWCDRCRVSANLWQCECDHVI